MNVIISKTIYISLHWEGPVAHIRSACQKCNPLWHDINDKSVNFRFQAVPETDAELDVQAGGRGDIHPEGPHLAPSIPSDTNDLSAFFPLQPRTIRRLLRNSGSFLETSPSICFDMLCVRDQILLRYSKLNRDVALMSIPQ